MTRQLIAFVVIVAPLMLNAAEPQSASTSRQQFEQLFVEISNWGRWGEDDELGTLNLLTPEIKQQAARLVKKGISISLALDLDKRKSEFNPHPFVQVTTRRDVGGQSYAFDKYSVEFHGPLHTHIDGLGHIMHNGKLYNGFSPDLIKADGVDRLGIHRMKDGIFTRGVLVDMAWLRGVDYLEPGLAIKATDLEAWEAKTGIRIRAGDALLIRTGRWERDRQTGPHHLVHGAAGLHASVAKWLKQRDVAVLGSDGGNDVLPSGVEGVQAPLHELVLAGLGMPMMDSLELDSVSNEAQRQGRWEFLFIATPLRVPGGTGAPINPLAVF